MRPRIAEYAAYFMDQGPVFFHDPPVCCGIPVGYCRGAIVLREVAVGGCSFVTVAYPRCPVCGKLVEILDGVEEYSAATA